MIPRVDDYAKERQAYQCLQDKVVVSTKNRLVQMDAIPRSVERMLSERSSFRGDDLQVDEESSRQYKERVRRIRK